MAKLCQELEWLLFFWDTVYRSQLTMHLTIGLTDKG